jgi:hypothetical protein
MMCAMSETNDGAIRSPIEGEEAGVLAQLPRTRPQRASPRRAAARKAAAGKADSTATGDATANAVAPPPSKPAPRRASGRRATPRSGPRAEPDRVPRQGYECAEEAATGPVQPPGGAELFVSAVEIVGELAKSGLTTGERLLRDALSRLPLS